MAMVSCFSFAKDFSLNVTLSQKQIQKANQYVWIFVPGFLNETVSWSKVYFKDNVDRLKQYIPSNQIYILHPFTRNSVSQNAEYLFNEFKKMYLKHQKKLMVITHSKGSPETIFMLAKKSKEASNYVEAVFGMQSGFGTEIADLFEFLNPMLSEGLKSLSIFAIQKIFNSHIIRELQIQPVPIYFLRTSQKLNNMNLFFEPTARYLNGYGPNDGVITSERQKLNGVGIDLGEINADHSDTVLPFPLSNSFASFRYALTDAIIAYLVLH